jgi:hypothetical protein
MRYQNRTTQFAIDRNCNEKARRCLAVTRAMVVEVARGAKGRALHQIGDMAMRDTMFRRYAG